MFILLPPGRTVDVEIAVVVEVVVGEEPKTQWSYMFQTKVYCSFSFGNIILRKLHCILYDM